MFYITKLLLSEFFLNSLTVILDHFTKAYNNYLIMGDFNLEPHVKRLGYFLNSNNLVNLVKTNICFKGSGSCIDLILTNRKYSFKNTTSYDTGLSDHYHMILTILKTTFQRKEPKCLIYRASNKNLQRMQCINKCINSV